MCFLYGSAGRISRHLSNTAPQKLLELTELRAAVAKHMREKRTLQHTTAARRRSLRPHARRRSIRSVVQYSGSGSRRLAHGWTRCHSHAMIRTMRATIDAAGRIVVPKPLREALGLKPGLPLEIRASDRGLEIEIAVTPMRLTKRGKGVVAVPARTLPRLSSDQVRETLERVRR
jgi:AbrB family looped-hinge helix DNA binding protein